MYSPEITSYAINKSKVLVAQSCPTLCKPMDCRPPDSSVHGILFTRILEWVAIPFSRESSQPREKTQGSCIAGRFFTIWATREALPHHSTDILVLLWLNISYSSSLLTFFKISKVEPKSWISAVLGSQSSIITGLWKNADILMILTLDINHWFWLWYD